MKKLLSFMIAALFVVALLPGGALAQATFAYEIDVDGVLGTALANPGGIMDNTHANGFGASAGELRYFRYTLSPGVLFGANPTLTFPGHATLIAQGGVGANYVIFSVTAAAGGYLQTDTCTLAIDPTGLTVYDHSPVNMSFAHYANEPDAVNQTGALATLPLSVIAWADALLVTADAVFPDLIDVSQGSLYFDGSIGDTTTIMGDVNVLLNPAAVLWTDGLAAAMTDIVAAGTTLDITGDFSAALDPGGVFLDQDGDATACNTVSQVAVLSATSAIFAIDDQQVADLDIICFICDQTDMINKGTYAALYNSVPVAGSDQGDVNLDPISEFEKNGVTRYVYNIPGDDHPDMPFIRIYNISPNSGTVYGTMYDQDGTVIGTASTVMVPDLASQATEIFDASELEAMFGTWSYRARLVIEAEVSDLEVMGLIRSSTGTITNMSPMAPESTP